MCEKYFEFLGQDISVFMDKVSARLARIAKLSQSLATSPAEFSEHVNDQQEPPLSKSSRLISRWYGKLPRSVTRSDKTAVENQIENQT